MLTVHGLLGNPGAVARRHVMVEIKTETEISRRKNQEVANALEQMQRLLNAMKRNVLKNQKELAKEKMKRVTKIMVQNLA